MNKNNYAIIMAGGIGSRFWPWSTTGKPKQFLDIFGTGKTLLEQTFERLLPLCPAENILIVTNELYRKAIEDSSHRFLLKISFVNRTGGIQHLVLLMALSG